jgi:hypothetical protein
MGEDPFDGFNVEKFFHDMDLYITIETMETETMATCVNHPDKSAGLVCMKYQINFCEPKA